VTSGAASGSTASGSAGSGVATGAASGSSAGSTGSTSGSTSGASSPDDGGLDEGASEGGGSGEAGGGCAGYQLCDDFEGVAPGAATSPWTIDAQAYTVETIDDATMAHSGTHAVHVKATAASGRGYIVETKTFPATDFWGRAWILLQAQSGGHEVFLAMDGANNEQVRILNNLGGGKIATNRRSDDQSKQSNTAYPMGTWACYEWHETPTELHVYFQGKELTDADEMWTEPVLSSVRAGFERFTAGNAGDIYIDDVAINGTQIGCN
jgi:hypothetical protein